MSELGDEVRRLLAERGVSLHEAARLAHYDVSYLSKVVNGRKPGSRELAVALDKVLDADGRLAALVNGQDRRGGVSDIELIELARRAEASMSAATRWSCSQWPWTACAGTTRSRTRRTCRHGPRAIWRT